MKNLNFFVQVGSTEELNVGPVMHEELCIDNNFTTSFGN